MSDTAVECPLCEQVVASPFGRDDWFRRDISGWNCMACGPFGMTDECRTDSGIVMADPFQRSRLSAFTREWQLLGGPIPVLFGDRTNLPGSEWWIPVSLEEALARFPRTVGERMDRALMNLARRSDRPGRSVELNTKLDYPLMFAENPDAMAYLLDQITDRGWIKTQPGPKTTVVLLTADGWDRVATLQETPPNESEQAFVAMWFDPGMNAVYDEGFAPAIRQAGYVPFRMDRKDFLNKVCDEIAAEIRRSHFLVADFTEERGGVYFEAGFAMGLGIPVVFTCRRECIKGVHFDTKDYNHILWDAPEDLRAKLSARIEATIPKPVPR